MYDVAQLLWVKQEVRIAKERRHFDGNERFWDISKSALQVCCGIGNLLGGGDRRAISKKEFSGCIASDRREQSSRLNCAID